MDWTERYRPQSLDALIVTEEKRAVLQQILTKQSNSILHGAPGTGKTSFFKILAQGREENCLKINASLNTGIDTIRGKIEPFSRRANFEDSKKLIYFEEADRLSKESQDSLKYIIDNLSEINQFIFLANDIDKITDALLSRCKVLCLDDPPKEAIISHCQYILSSNNREIDDLNKIVDEKRPDIRKIVSTIETYSREMSLPMSNTSKSIDDDVLLVGEEKIDTAVHEINKIVQTTLNKGMTQLGQYVLDNFFDGDITKVKDQRPYKDVSFNSLSQREDLLVKPSTLLQAVRVVAQERHLTNIDFGQLTYSHKAALLPLKNDKDKKALINQCKKSEWSVRKLKEKVQEKISKSFAPRQITLKQEAGKFRKSVERINPAINGLEAAFQKESVKNLSDEEKEELKNEVSRLRDNLSSLLKKIK